MSPESPESPKCILGLSPEKESKKSSISIDTGLWTSPDSGPVKILLSEAASKALAEAGDAFLIIGKGSYPDSAGRMVIHCLPVSMKEATDACKVALGSHRAVKK